jgi:sulfopyruvate decarboxylase TPP-binding subunit
MLFSGPEIEAAFSELGVTHVVWIPDSALGPWERALEDSSHLRLIRVCREGEAWPIAAGLRLGGALPVVVMQTTGLFESGDAMRNVLFDLQQPICAVIGARSWLVENSKDSAKRFTEPILDAWGIDYQIVACGDDKYKLQDHLRHCQTAEKHGAVLIAEDRA